MESNRQLKVARLLQKELGDLFLREKHLFSGVFISVTKVRVSPDLSSARIYLSMFGTADKPSCLQQIKDHYRELRGKLGERVGKQLRIVPQLSFFIDDSDEYLAHIEELLNRKG